MRKKSLLVYLLFFFCLIFSVFPVSNIEVIQKPICSVKMDVESDFNDTINDQLKDLDFGNIEDVIKDFDDNSKNIFGETSFLEKIFKIIKGENLNNYTSIWDMIKSLLFDNILSLLPIIATIIAIAILGGMVGNLRTSSNGKSMESIIHFIIYGLTVILISSTIPSIRMSSEFFISPTFLISSIIFKMINLTSSTLDSIKKQTEVIFPVLLTLLTAMGGTTSVGVYQPVMSFFSSTIIGLFTSFIMPLFLISVALNFISNLSNNVKLDKLSGFINSLFKWVIGIAFTLFTAFVSIQGISVAAVDGLSIRTAKFTIKNTLPVVGSYISDGLFLIIASSNLIKNAVGGAGLLLLLATIISPIIQLVLFILALKLMAGIIQPLGDNKIAEFISSLSKNMSMLIVMLVCVSFMYVILTGLVICSVNVI